MADEEVRQPELLLKIGEDIEHLGLHRKIERRNRFVEHENTRIEHQRAGDCDPLALTA